MTNDDKSLIEVWDWKEKLYQESKNLSAKQFITKTKKNADKILSDNNVKLTTIHHKKEDGHKIA